MGAKETIETMEDSIKEKILEDIISAAKKIKLFFLNLSGRGQMVLWIVLIFLFGVLFWGLTSPVRHKVEINAVNKVLEEKKERRRLKDYISPWLLSGSFSEAGNWYTIEDGSICVVFTILKDGISSPFLAIFNRSAKIDKLYPLSVNSALLLKSESDVVIELWSGRVEKAARAYYAKIRTKKEKR